MTPHVHGGAAPALTHSGSKAGSRGRLGLSTPDLPPARSVAAALVALVVAAPACREAPPPDLEPLGPIDEHVEWTAALPLEGGGPGPASAFAPDGRNGLLAVDLEDRRLSVWRERRGALRRAGGTDVAGMTPTSVHRTPAGRIIVTTIEGDVVQIDPDGSREERRAATTVSPLWNAFPRPEGGFLLVGSIVGPREEQLHVWVPQAGGIQRSLFRPPIPEPLQGALNLAGRPAAAVRGDTVAAVHSLSDSLTLLSGATGEVLERLHLPFRHFQVAADPPADTGAIPGWFHRTWFVTDVWWLAEGGFLVQTGRVADQASHRTALLALERDGNVRFDLPEGPRLVAVSEERLYFLEPGEGPPARVLVGRLRR